MEGKREEAGEGGGTIVYGREGAAAWGGKRVGHLPMTRSRRIVLSMMATTLPARAIGTKIM